MRSKDDGVRLGEGWDFRVADGSVCGMEDVGVQGVGGVLRVKEPGSGSLLWTLVGLVYRRRKLK